jgi:Ca-activated chloride channel family protein
MSRTKSAAAAVGIVAACMFVGVEACGEGELKARLGVERTKLLAGSRTRVGAVLRLSAPEGEDDLSPAPVSIALVMDRSGSMNGAGKIGMVHAAGTGLVDRLASHDELGLVAYSNWSDVLRPMAPVADAIGVKTLISSLAPGGGTNLGGGLESGIGFFRKAARNGHVKRLLLLTDGLANKGITDPDALARLAAQAFASGVHTTTVGLGRNYNEKLLAKIAHAGGGEFHYVTGSSDLPDLFRAELEQGRSVVVRDLVATVRTSTGARFVEMVGYPATGGTERAREVRIGDLFSKQERASVLLFDLEPPAAVEGALWRAGTVELAWNDANARARRKAFPLTFEVTASESAVAESAVEEVRARVIENENYRSLDKAMDLFRKGDRLKALAKIKEAQIRISADPAAAGDAKLIGQAGELAQARREIEQGENARSVAIHNTDVSNYGFRNGVDGNRQQARAGGSGESHAAVTRSIPWLARHQAIDGSWGTGADRRLRTSLALLAILASGHTEKSGAHRTSVAKGVAWLVARQQVDGRIGEGSTPVAGTARYRDVYTHAVCTTALAEAFGMARVERTGAAARKAIDWFTSARPFALADDAFAGEATVTDDDVAGIGWCVMALKSALVAGIVVQGGAPRAAEDFLDRHEIAGNDEMRKRYAFAGGEARGLDTMVGLFVRAMLGGKHADILPSALGAISGPGGLPEWGDRGEAFDWYYVYFANLVCFRMGGDVWRKWNGRLRDTLVSKMHSGIGEGDGSWDPVGTFLGRDRTMSTAVASLCLEVYYRYLPLYR